MGLIFLLPLVGTLLAWAGIKRLLGPVNTGSTIVAVVSVGAVFFTLLMVALVVYLSWYTGPHS